MRKISTHLIPIDRQVTESINILAAGKMEKESLNLKTQLGGAKISSILVHSPKGLGEPGSSVGEEEGNDGEDTETAQAEKRLREAIKRGQKCLKYV